MSNIFQKFLILCLLSFSCELIVEIEKDFNFNIDYRLEKQETTWKSRGQLSFRKKDPINYKSTASLVNFNLIPEMKKQISNECKLNGNYILQFTNEAQKNETYYSSIKACALVSTNFHDKLILNTGMPIEPDLIKSLSYMADYDYDDNFEDDDEEDDDEGDKKKGKGANNKKGLTKIEISQIKNIEGPYFSEDDEGLDETSKKKKAAKDAPPQSILGKYWWIIALVMFMMMMSGGKEQEGEQGQGQTQGQAQGNTK